MFVAFSDYSNIDFLLQNTFHPTAVLSLLAYVTNSRRGRENFIADILKLFSHQSLSRNHVLEMHDRGVGST